MKSSELSICGLAAVKARFAREPGSIRRLYFDYATGRKIGIICRTLAQARKIYRCVEPAELEKISGTLHHGGIVAVVESPPLGEPSAADIALWARKRVPLLVLDQIGNAHNLGAIVRTAAFFGLPIVIIPEGAGSARPNDAAYRVAEGGFEHLEVRSVADLPEFLRAAASTGYEVLGASVRGKPLHRPSTVRRPPPTAIVLGNEEAGLSAAVEKACTRLVKIPGTGKVESLNVSVAAAILIWDLMNLSGQSG